MRLSLKILIGSTFLAIAFLAAWVIHGFMTGAMLPTYQDPTPEIQAKMAIHVPINLSLLGSGVFFIFLSIIFGFIYLVGRFRKNGENEENGVKS